MQEKEFEIVLHQEDELDVKYQTIPEKFNLWVLKNEYHSFDQTEKSGLRIFISQQLYEEVNQHAQSDLDNEVGGILIGDVYMSDDNSFIIIENSIEAEFTKATPSSVVFTHETWAQIYKLLEKEYANKKVIGWYHTHPGIDIFFSGNDHYVHRTLFSNLWQVGLVIEPVKNLGGFFQWDGTNIRRSNIFYELLESVERTSVVKWKNMKIQEATNY